MPDALTDLNAPQIDTTSFAAIDQDRLLSSAISTHPSRILILYGSLRAILTALGAEVRIFHPSGLPLVDDRADARHPKVRELVARCEGMVRSSPERHGAMTGLMKT